jgi:hypothetical protein
VVADLVKGLPYAETGSGESVRCSVRESHNAELLRLAFDKGYHVDDDGVLWSYTGNAMHPGPGSTGYPRFTLVTPEDGRRSVMVHRLVGLQKFGDLVFRADLVLRHLDGNPLNFKPANIGIGTERENSLDRTPEERLAHAKKAAAALRALSPAQARRLIELRRRGATYRELRDRFHVSLGTVSYLLNGRTYPELHREALHA